MKTDNLSKWVDELAASIETLEKKVNAINVTPVPAAQYRLIPHKLVDYEEVGLSSDTYTITSLENSDIFVINFMFRDNSVDYICTSVTMNYEDFTDGKGVAGSYVDQEAQPTKSCSFVGYYDDQNGEYVAQALSGSGTYRLDIIGYELEEIEPESYIRRMFKKLLRKEEKK